MNFSVEWVEDAAGLAALASEWDAVLPADSRPFDQHCWYQAWWAAFGKQRRLALCTVRDGGALVGALPLQHGERGLEALANSHSEMFRPLASSPEAMEALVEAAAASAGELYLRQLRRDDAAVETLCSGVRRAGMLSLFEAGSSAAIVETDGDLDAWVAGHDSSWKKRLRRYRRKMEKDHEATIEIARAPGDLEAELAEGFAIEASGWKGQAGTAIVSHPDTEAFYRSIAAAFGERGELRLSRIALDGTPVAFSFCLEHRRRLYSLKVGYDEGFRKLVPGLVMQLSIIEACFEREVETYELLGERTEWKAKVATSTRPHVNLRAYRRRPAGLARYAYRAALRPHLRAAYRRLARSG